MIDKNSTISEILETKKGNKILKKYGVPCLSCPFASQEIKVLKIGDVCKMYGLDIDGIIKDLQEQS